MGLLAAFYSKQFFLLLIQTNNALAAIFECSNVAATTDCTKGVLNTVINAPTTGTVAGALQIVYGVMGFLLIIEEAARIAVIYLLFAFSPILFFLASLRETERWAKSTALAAILFILLQAMQAATLNVGESVLSGVFHNSASQLGFLNLLVAIAILYITLLLFFSITRMAFGFAGGPFALAPLEMSRDIAGAGGLARDGGHPGGPLPRPRERLRRVVDRVVDGGRHRRDRGPDAAAHRLPRFPWPIFWTAVVVDRTLKLTVIGEFRIIVACFFGVLVDRAQNARPEVHLTGALLVPPALQLDGVFFVQRAVDAEIDGPGQHVSEHSVAVRERPNW